MKVFRPSYTTPTGEKKLSPTWWVQFKLKGTRYRISTGYTSYRPAQKEGNRIYEAKQNDLAGLNTFDATRATPLPKLIEEFVAERRRLGRVEDHVAGLEARLAVIFKGLTRLEDVTPDEIRRRLCSIAETPSSAEWMKGRTVTGRTQNRYRAAAFAFFRSLVKANRWPMNPVAAVEAVHEDEPDARRALSPDEFERLLAATTGPDTANGEARRVAYLVAATTGLRRKEFGSLLVSDLRLDESGLVIRGKVTKKRKGTMFMPLLPRVVEALKAHVAAKKADDRKPESPVFETVPSVETLRSDLVRAGVLEEGADGERDFSDGRLDFHALRVTFITDLARAGVSLAQAQKLARHSTPILTANVYTRLEIVDDRAALSKLDALHQAAASAADAAKGGQAGDKEPVYDVKKKRAVS